MTVAKRWIGNVDVSVDDDGLLTVGAAPPETFVGGTKTVASAATAEPLVGTPTPCRAVWIGARISPVDAVVNTASCRIGDNASQNIPITQNNFEGMVIPIDDAAKLYVKVQSNGEGVAYRIFA
jgi:hypothetical protein